MKTLGLSEAGCLDEERQGRRRNNKEWDKKEGAAGSVGRG